MRMQKLTIYFPSMTGPICLGRAFFSRTTLGQDFCNEDYLGHGTSEAQAHDFDY